LPFHNQDQDVLRHLIIGGWYIFPRHSPRAPEQVIIKHMLTIDPDKRASLLDVRNSSWLMNVVHDSNVAHQKLKKRSLSHLYSSL